MKQLYLTIQKNHLSQLNKFKSFYHSKDKYKEIAQKKDNWKTSHSLNNSNSSSFTQKEVKYNLYSDKYIVTPREEIFEKLQIIEKCGGFHTQIIIIDNIELSIKLEEISFGLKPYNQTPLTGEKDLRFSYNVTTMIFELLFKGSISIKKINNNSKRIIFQKNNTTLNDYNFHNRDIIPNQSQGIHYSKQELKDNVLINKAFSIIRNKLFILS